MERPAGLPLVVALVVLAACDQVPEKGVLVGQIGDSSPMYKTKIEFPTRAEHYQFSYELKNARTTCSLTGNLPSKQREAPETCEEVSGVGQVSCDNGYQRRIRWQLSSCRSGFGATIPSHRRHAGPTFSFGFSHNKERALDELAKAQRAQ